ncbi:MAG TPA: hypothetical protein VHX38_00715 [Pseudonocardiaceae bacterium]|nr:hypothetical protein [Pseudonocardiaceae bacterium]
MPIDRPFSVDEDYDTTHASTGSRYGNYLASRTRLFVDTDTERPGTDPLSFAATAFTIAQSPVMSPGYVRSHPRIQAVNTHWDDNGRLAIEVGLAAPLPAPIAAAIGGRGWQDWTRDYHSGWWFEPFDCDRPSAHTLVIVRVPIIPDTLPTPAYHHDGAPDIAAAKAAVRVVCHQLNRSLTDIFTALGNYSR